MTTEPEASPSITRRYMLIGGIAVIAVVAAGGAGHYLWNSPDTAAAQSGSGGEVPMADLLAPGPLGDEIQGSADAPVTIVEYASMTCPHCSHFHETTYPELKKKYIDTGKVRFIFREFPLDQLAAAAFMLARCGAKERYFPMVETLFQQQRTWAVQRPLQPLMAISKQAGLSEASFNECLKNQQVLDGIEDVRQRAANKFNVQSTPTFFVNGKQLRGAATLAEFEKEMAPYL